MTKTPTPKTVEALKHFEATRKNIPTAEYQSVLEKEQQAVKQIRYPRNTDLDPQLVWRGKEKKKGLRVQLTGSGTILREVICNGADGIACWFIDTDYNEESIFVRHAYFLGANDPYSALKTALKAEINEEAWATLNSDTSRPFEKPK